MSEDAPIAAAQGDLPTYDNIVAEGERLVSLAASAGLTARLLGGVAVRVRCPSAQLPPFARSYGDLDLAAPRKDGRGLRGVLEVAGYTADRHFNALHGDRRLIYVDTTHNRHIDIFLGAFRMCHVLELEDRLALDAQTLTPADLLLTKLQVVQLNAKDVLDALALLHDFELTTNAGVATDQVIDGAYIADLCAHDWGWYTTVSDNLEKITTIGRELTGANVMEVAAKRINALRTALEAAPKSMKWNLRAAVGRRVQWYEEPEEVAR
jgi:hypothetical protein